MNEKAIYCAKQKLDGKGQEAYDLIHMWDINLKAKNEKTRQNTQILK